MNPKTTTPHKFEADSGMSFQEVFDFAYSGLIPVLHGLSREFGEDRFFQALEKIVFQCSLTAAQDSVRGLPSNDFSAYTAPMRAPSRFAKNILSVEIVEDLPQAMQVQVSECLWAKVFRELGAAEIGYSLICHRDYASCQGFNPRIKLVRTKTLMQGDDCCDHRFVWEGKMPG